jgi:hypothetical protein
VGHRPPPGLGTAYRPAVRAGRLLAGHGHRLPHLYQSSRRAPALPDWDASEEEIDRRVEQLEAIPKPVTGEEARALVSCFGPDDCHGVAGTLLHLIDTGPNPVLTTDPDPRPKSGTGGSTPAP